MIHIHETIQHQLNQYLQYYPEEAFSLNRLSNQLKNGNIDITSRHIMPGHVTGSAIVRHSANSNYWLLLHHPFLKKWVQPGGHVDENEVPVMAAKRELEEETGMKVTVNENTLATLTPIDIDIHEIPESKKKGEPSHFHYDYRYLLEIENDTIGENSEGNDVKWVHVDEIMESDMRRIVEKLK